MTEKQYLCGNCDTPVDPGEDCTGCGNTCECWTGAGTSSWSPGPCRHCGDMVPVTEPAAPKPEAAPESDLERYRRYFANNPIF